MLENLLKNDGVEYINILPKRRKSNKLSIAIAQLKKDISLARIIKNKKYHILLGTDPALAHIGKLFRIPSIITQEDDARIIPDYAWLTYPFTKHILSPISCNLGRWSKKKIAYKGYQKLAYLHPNRFIPNREKINNFVKENEKFYLLRFADLSAHHDISIKGMSKEIARNIIKILTRYGKVFISSEKPLEKEFQAYRSPFHINDIHHVIYYSELYIGDSQSMAVEAAMLGVPSIRFNDFAGRIGVLEELEKKYGLTFGIHSSKPQKLYNKINELLSISDLREVWKKKREQMLSGKIDVTAFIVWLIDKYPESINIIKNNPDIQNKFI